MDITVSSSDAPGAVLASSYHIQYYAGTPGTVVYDVGKACTEAVAMSAGRAVTHVGVEKLCEGIQGIRIVIGDTFESIHSGFELVNLNFGNNGTQSSVANQYLLKGPVVLGA